MLALNGDDKKKLSGMVETVAKRLADIKELQDEIKEICADADDQLGVQKKVVRQLAKEKNWNEEERIKQRALEDELDVCRSALGLLAETPLGEAAQDDTRKRANSKGKGKKPTHAAVYA